MSEETWSIQVEPMVLLPGRSAKVTVQYNPERDHEVSFTGRRSSG